MRKRVRRFAHRWWLSWQEQSAIRLGDIAAAASVHRQIRVEEYQTRETREVHARTRL